MFSYRYKDDADQIALLLSSGESGDPCTMFSQSSICFEEAVSLLRVNPSLQPELYHYIVEKARHSTRSLFHNDVFSIVPVYVTSICNECCTYCNYQQDNSKNVSRLRLTDDELMKEIRFLAEQKGLRTVELVYSSDPMMDADTICRHVDFVKRYIENSGGGLVGLNAPSFNESEYRSLVSAGLDFAVLWQETYDEEVFKKVHPINTRKSNFHYRLNTQDRMIAGGLVNIGLGVLSGLADWRKDWGMLFAHQAYLRNLYGINAPIIGVPRLKPVAGSQYYPKDLVPSDEEFLLCIALQKIFNPPSLPFINTRESWDFCINASQGGGVLFTFNCHTVPGGYTSEKKGHQFPSFNFDVSKFRDKAVKRGINPLMKWNFAENGTS